MAKERDWVMMRTMCQRSSWPTSQCCPAWANWQLINALVDDVNKNTCMGGRFACCYVWPKRPSCPLLSALVELLLADRLPGSRRFGKTFPYIWKGMLLAITLRNKENVSNDLETSWSGGRKHSHSCQDFGHIPLSSILPKK